MCAARNSALAASICGPKAALFSSITPTAVPSARLAFTSL
jgi:hypothetical protein